MSPNNLRKDFVGQKKQTENVFGGMSLSIRMARHCSKECRSLSEDIFSVHCSVVPILDPLLILKLETGFSKSVPYAHKSSNHLVCRFHPISHCMLLL